MLSNVMQRRRGIIANIGQLCLCVIMLLTKVTMATYFIICGELAFFDFSCMSPPISGSYLNKNDKNGTIICQQSVVDVLQILS